MSKYQVLATGRGDEISPRTKVAFELLDRSPDISSTLHFSVLLSDRADRVGPITRSQAVSRQNSECPLSSLQTWPTFIPPPLIEFHDISTNFLGVYRGICEAKMLETVWKWPSISPLATRNIEVRVTGGDENSSTSTLYISCSLKRIGSE